MKYQAPQIDWQEPKSDSVLDCNGINPVYHPDVICFFANPLNSYFIRKNPETTSPKPFVMAYGGRVFKEFATIEEAKEWVEQIHYPSALIKTGFKPVSEPLSDTQPRPTDAVERQTLIEKLEQEYKKWCDREDNSVFGGVEQLDARGRTRGLKDAIDIIKQHTQPPSEVQDD